MDNISLLNPLLDNEFLQKLFKEQRRVIQIKIISLDLDDYPIETIEGRVTQGSINLDGKSSMRRSCSLTVASSLETNLEDSVNWSLNTKIKIEIGLENQIEPNYPEVIWFNMGYYILSNFSYNKTATNYTIQLQGKDKMCLLNGTVSGEIYASVDFGMESLLNKKTGESRLVEIPVQDIIYEGVREYAREPYRNIIIKDLPQQGLNLLQWNNSNNLYVIRSADTQTSTEAENALVNRTVYWQNNGTVVKTTFDDLVNEPDFHWSSLNNLGAIEPEETSIITLDNTSGAKQYCVAKIAYGQTIGFEPDYLIYPHGEDDSGLTVGPGGVFTEILDKIVNFLGDYEYFYNVDGQFVFQKKRENLDLIWNGNIGVNDVGMGNDYFPTSDVPISWNFNGEEVVTTISDTPNIGNIKNDYSVWGNRTIEGGEVPIHFRQAIDHKPEYYNSIYMSGEEIKAYVDKHPEFKDSFTHSTVNGEEVYDDVESINYYTSVSPYPIPNMESYMVDWREIIYQMAKDYLRFKHFDEFHARLAAANIVNGTTHLYPQGITGYEQYYVDIEGGWRSLYRPTEYEDSVIEFKSVVKDEGDYNPNVPIYLKDDWEQWMPATGEYDPLNNDYQVLSYNGTPTTNGALPVLFKDPYRVMLKSYLGYTFSSSWWSESNEEYYDNRYNKIDISLGNGEEPWQYIKKGVFGYNSELAGLDTNLTNHLGVGVQTENANGILSTLTYVNGSYIPELTVPFSTVLDDPTKYHILFTNDYNLIIPMNTTLYESYERAKLLYSPSDFYCIYQIKNYETIEDQDTTSNGYKVGDKCCYDTSYYRCKKEVAKGASWNGAYWENYSRTYDIEYYIAESYPDDIEGINHPEVSLIRVNITSTGLQYYDSTENKERGFYGSVYRVGLTASAETSNKVLLNGKNSIIISRVSTIESVQGKGAKSYVTFNWNSDNNMIIKNIFSDGLMGDINSQGTYTDYYINTEGCKVIDSFSGPMFKRSKTQLSTPSKYESGNAWIHMNIFYKQNQAYGQYQLNNSYYIARMSSFSGSPIFSTQGGVIIDEETIPYCQESTLFKPFEVNGVVSNWNEYIQTNPEKLNFWFDFLESETDSQIGKYGANKIQQRSKATSDDKAGAIVYLDTLNIAWRFSSDDAEQNAKQDQLSPFLQEAEQTLMNIPQYFKDSFVYSAKAKSCKDVINQWLFDYTWAQETLNFSALPIYSLQPNDLVAINNGIQRVNTISIPLTFNGTMSVGCSKIVDQSNYSMPGAGDIVPPAPEPEPEPESEWLYHIENIDCNYTPSMDRYRSIQPENIGYLQQQIQPFSYENRERDWVIEVSAEPTTSSNLTLPILNYTSNKYYDPEVYPEISGNRIGGPLTNIELRQGSGGKTLGIWSSDGHNTQFEPYGENDYFNHFFPIEGGPANKKVTFVKEGDKIQVYVEDELLTTLRIKTPCTSRCRIGTIMKDFDSGFVGNLNYYRFKFTSDFQPFFNENELEEFTQSMIEPECQQATTIDSWQTRDDKKEVTYEEVRIDFLTSYQQYSDKHTHWLIQHEPKDEYDIMQNTTQESGGKAPPVTGTWRETWDHLTSDEFDGFGIEFQPNDVANIPQVATYSNGNTYGYGIDKGNIEQGSYGTGQGDPTIFDGGCRTGYSDCGMQLNYIKDTTNDRYNQLKIWGGSGSSQSLSHIFNKDYPVKVIYFKKYNQLIAFTGKRALGQTAGETSQTLPTSESFEDYYKFYGIGNDSNAAVTANGGCLFRLFTIKYKED